MRVTIGAVDQLAGELLDLKRRCAALERSISGVGGPYLPLSGGAITGNLTISGTLGATGAVTMGSTLGVTGVITGPSAVLNGSGGGAKLSLDGAVSNWIAWNVNGVAAPSYTTRSAGTKLLLYPLLSGSSADYAIGIDSGTLWYSTGETGNTHSWYCGNVNVGDWDNGGIELPGTRSLEFTSYGGGWFMQDTSWIRAVGGKSVWIGSGQYGTDGGVTIGFGGATNALYQLYVAGNAYWGGYLYTNSNITALGQVQAHRNGGSAGGGATSNNYYDATFYANPAAVYGPSTASIAFHSSGVAPQLRVGANDPQIYNRDYPGTGNNPFTASAFNVASTKRIKKNITPWPLVDAGAATERATEVVSRLQAVTFERDEPSNLKEVPVGRRSEAFRRLANYALRNDLPPYELPDHDCSIHDCNGDAENPCARVLNQQHAEYGLIAEQVYEVLPEAVVLDGERLPNSINYSMIDAVLVAAVKELTERLASVEAELASR